METLVVPVETPELDTISQEKLAVARVLREYGWGQSFYAQDDEGQEVPFAASSAAYFCVLGAYMRVFPETEGDGEARCNFARSLGFRDSSKLIQWNDNPRREMEEVLALLES